MDEEMKELKSVLRSLVVSSPSQVDVRSLQRDYHSMMGSTIPIHKWGYRDVLSFLRERCSDCFVIQGLSGNPVLTLIVPDSLKHIDKFVQKQRASTTTKMRGKRRSIPETVIKQPEKPKYDKSMNMISESFHNKARSTQSVQPVTKSQDLSTKSYNQGGRSTANYVSMSNNREARPSANTNSRTSRPSANNVPLSSNSNNRVHRSTENYTPISTNSNKQEIKPIKNDPVRTNNHNGTNNSYSKMNTATVNNNTICKPELSHTESHRGPEHKSDTNKDTNENVKRFLRKRLPMYDSALELDGEPPAESSREAAKEQSDSGRHTSSSSSSRRSRIEELTGELLELLRASTHGILVTELMLVYRDHFGRDLLPSQFGFNNLSGLLYTLDERVAFAESPDGMYMLDPSAPPPPPRPRLVVHTWAATTQSHDDPLPGIEIAPEVFPPDCMQLLESIPGPELSGVAPGAMLPVAVAEVYSPTHFWLQRLGAEHASAMHALMDDMTEYYSRGEGKARVLARGAVLVGHYCAALYEGDWHRALVVKVLDTETVKVRYIDYGTVLCVCARALKPLRRCYAGLRAQAVRARLARLRPAAAARRWHPSAAAHFLGLVKDKYFVANVVAVDLEEVELETLLIDTSGEDDVCIGEELVRAGYADPRAGSALGSGETYLRPRWEPLETGETPTYAEIHRYLADGIDLDCVQAYSSHVPSALPPREPGPAPAERARTRQAHALARTIAACSLSVSAASSLSMSDASSLSVSDASSLSVSTASSLNVTAAPFTPKARSVPPAPQSSVAARSMPPAPQSSVAARSMPPAPQSTVAARSVPPAPQSSVAARSAPPAPQSSVAARSVPPAPQSSVAARSVPPAPQSSVAARSVPPAPHSTVAARSVPPAPQSSVAARAVPPAPQSSVAARSVPPAPQSSVAARSVPPALQSSVAAKSVAPAPQSSVAARSVPPAPQSSVAVRSVPPAPQSSVAARSVPPAPQSSVAARSVPPAPQSSVAARSVPPAPQSSVAARSVPPAPQSSVAARSVPPAPQSSVAARSVSPAPQSSVAARSVPPAPQSSVAARSVPPAPQSSVAARSVPPAPQSSVATGALPAVHSDPDTVVPPQGQSMVAAEPCPMCTWAADYLDSTQKTMYKMLLGMDPNNSHYYIMSALHNGSLRPPWPPGLPAPAALYCQPAFRYSIHGQVSPHLGSNQHS